jgi:hypothetical protein
MPTVTQPSVCVQPLCHSILLGSSGGFGGCWPGGPMSM